MLDVNELTVGQLKEIKNLFRARRKPSTVKEMGKHICILQRGWIVIGDLRKEGHDYLLSEAAVIRNWGTTKGIGELAKNGPTDKTVLDPSPDMRFHELTVVAIIKAN